MVGLARLAGSSYNPPMPTWTRPATAIWTVVVLSAAAGVLVSGVTHGLALVPLILTVPTVAWAAAFAVLDRRQRAAEDDSVDLIGYSRLGRLDRLPDGGARSADLGLGAPDPAERLRAAVGSPPSAQAAARMRALRRQVAARAAIED